VNGVSGSIQICERNPTVGGTVCDIASDKIPEPAEHNVALAGHELRISRPIGIFRADDHIGEAITIDIASRADRTAGHITSIYSRERKSRRPVQVGDRDPPVRRTIG
jgi:hypothetical protein